VPGGAGGAEADGVDDAVPEFQQLGVRQAGIGVLVAFVTGLAFEVDHRIKRVPDLAQGFPSHRLSADEALANALDDLFSGQGIYRAGAISQRCDPLHECGAHLRVGLLGSYQERFVQLVSIGIHSQPELYVGVVLQPELDFGGLVLRR
jgi:hypothetical protein